MFKIWINYKITNKHQFLFSKLISNAHEDFNNNFYHQHFLLTKLINFSICYHTTNLKTIV